MKLYSEIIKVSGTNNTKIKLTIVGKQVRNLNRICRCSDSLSNMWRRGPLLSEQRRQRSVNAVKLRSSGSVIAKHLMRRSRRQELSMYTAVVFGWRETSTHVAGSQGGVAPPLRSGGTGPCAAAPAPPPHPPRPPHATLRVARTRRKMRASFPVCNCRLSVLIMTSSFIFTLLWQRDDERCVSYEYI